MQELGSNYEADGSGLESYLKKNAPRRRANRSGDLYSYFDEKEAWIEKYIHPNSRTKDWELVVDESGDHQIYSWPLFTESFCNDMIQASEVGGEWSQSRHKFYPTTDKLLGWLDMNQTYCEILKEFVYPAAVHLYKLSGNSWRKLKFENFIAKYGEEGNQISLGLHHDTSLITALVNLSQCGKDFEGGGTYFQKQEVTIQPPKGYVCVHPGNITHKHGARPTTSGKRYIIVSFSSFGD